MARKDKGKDPNFPMQGRGGAMGGKYASKSTNLSKSVLKRAGAAKVAAKRTVQISDTKRVTSGPNAGRTVGPAGKPLNGTVVLSDGKRAVYKNGRRVEKSMAKPKSKPVATRSGGSSGGSGSGGSGGSGGGSRGPKTAASVLKLGKGDKVRTSAARDAARAAGPRQSAPTRAATSGTVAAAVAQGRAAGPGSGNGSRAGSTQGYVRGNPYAQQSAVTAARTGRKPVPGAVQAQTKNKRASDRRNQGRDAAAIAGLTVGPLIAGGALAAGARTAAAGAARALPAGRRPPALPAGRTPPRVEGSAPRPPVSPGPRRAPVTAAPTRPAVTRGTPQQRAAATRAANKAKIKQAEKNAKAAARRGK